MKETNKLIAEFMGVLVHETLTYGTHVLIMDEEHSFYNTVGRIVHIDPDDVGIQVSDGTCRWCDVNLVKPINTEPTLEYHKDWNALMGVIGKINQLGYSTDIKCYFIGGEPTYELLITDAEGQYNSDHGSFFDSQIEAVYETIEEFIKYYNQKNIN